MGKKKVTLAAENLFKKPEEPKPESLHDRIVRQRILSDITEMTGAMDKLGFTPEEKAEMAEMLDGLSIEEVLELQLPPKPVSAHKKGVKQRERRARRRLMRREFQPRTGT